MSINAVIDTIIIFTTRMRELARFYRAAFGLEKFQESPGYLGQQIGDIYLGFDQVDEALKSPGAVTIWFRVDDVQKAFDRLVKHGAVVRYRPIEKPWGDTLAAVYDPDGNMIGLSQRR